MPPRPARVRRMICVNRDATSSKRLVPVRFPAVNGWHEKTVGDRQRVLERRALGAQPAEIGGMVGIAFDRATGYRDAAADAAIGTGRADLIHAWPRTEFWAAPTWTSPAITLTGTVWVLALVGLPWPCHRQDR